MKVKPLSCVRPFAAPWTVACQAPPSMGLSRKEYWSGLSFPLQEIFPTQGLNPGPLHCRQTLYPLSHLGSPRSVQMIPSESLPLRLHACNFATVVQLSNQCHFRPLFASQPLTFCALLFNESATCASHRGCHPEGCTALAGCAHCLCLNHAPHPPGTPRTSLFSLR